MTKIKLNNLEISQEDLIKELENNPEIMEKLEEKFGKKDSGWFVPKEGEGYAYLNNFGGDCFTNYDSTLVSDVGRVKHQKVYRTRKEAQQESLRQQAKIRILKTIAEENAKVGWVCDWGDLNQGKGYLTYDVEDKVVEYYSSIYYRQSETDFYFSPEIGDIILEKCAEDYKIYLGVK